jgi:hypothetical protein
MIVPRPLPYSPDVEVVPPDEPHDIEQILEVTRALLLRDRESSGARRRDVHVKSHGCPAARFEVLPGLPAELRQGLFEHERSYPAAIRFSNSSPRPLPDAVPDGRGVAIKIREVTGQLIGAGATDPDAQDFIMVDSPTFIAADVKDYLRIEQARLEGLRRPQTAVKAFTGGSYDPRRWRWGGLLAAVSAAARFPVHPARLTYYSMSPFRFGDFVAKYRLVPAADPPSPPWPLSIARHHDAFRLALGKMLRASDLRFELQVQLRTNAERMPIEDASVLWSERESPFRPVARLVIPQQDLDASPFGLGDELAFSVWNSLESHRPLGGINRSRRAVYQLSASWRYGTLAE